jgi:hypothetical protein
VLLHSYASHRSRWLILGSLVLSAVGILAVMQWTESSEKTDGPNPERVPSGRPANLLILGGGPTPDLNQVSIEQDVALAVETVGPAAAVLYSGGPGTLGVRVLDAARLKAPSLRVALGNIFAPREGRASRYRPTTLRVTGAANAKNLSTALAAMPVSPDPLLLYLAGHGDRGDTAAGNRLSLWGRKDLLSAELAVVLDAIERPVRVVASMCFSGGFAELVFKAGDPGQGPTSRDRCGLFAAPWDLVASGCDPDPNRRSQEGFAVHFFTALRGTDRHGKILPRASIDFDGDGQISLLEAHTRVQIVSESADVPTTTSGRWLEYVAPAGGRMEPVALPEEQVIVETLSRRLDMTVREADAQLRTALDRLALDEQAIIEGEQDIEVAYQALAAAMLGRWPVIDDPWHPDYDAMLSTHATAIVDFLESSAEARAYFDGIAQLGTKDDFLYQQQRRSAQLERLVRAAYTLEAAGQLKARGGAEWETFRRLRQCERWVPDLAP